MSAAVLPNASATAASRQKKFWLVNPSVDLIIGCGAWTLPLIGLTHYLSGAGVLSLSFIFYFLTVFCNNPHYMATIYRAYGTSEDRSKYKVFTVYVTIFLVLTAIATHYSPLLLPYLFTIYLTWSPWHYTGQNFGISMMFARKAGVRGERRYRHGLYVAFFSSYVMWFLAIHSQFAENPYLVTLGIPPQVVTAAQPICLIVFLGAAAYALRNWSRGMGLRPLLPILVLLTTQFFWFVFPIFLTFFQQDSASAIYFSTGALAFMHCAQYLWITQHFAKREAASGIRPSWNPVRYYGILVIGGLALFLPGPWLISRAFSYNLVDSYLIFTALINIHHFILDGAIWKLRDGRIASLLLGAPGKAAKSARSAGGKLFDWAGWVFGPALPARSMRYIFAVGLVGLMVLDQTQYFLTRTGAKPENARIAARINPNDSRAAVKLAKEYRDQGEREKALALLQNTAGLNGYTPSVRRQIGNLLIEQGKLDAAANYYEELEQTVPPDLPTLVNIGVLAANRGNRNEAEQRFQKALTADSSRPDVHLNLAEIYFEKEDYESSIAHFDSYFNLVNKGKAEAAAPQRLYGAGLKMGESFLTLNAPRQAFETFKSTANLAASNGDYAASARALDRMADIQTDNRDFVMAVSIRRAAIENAERAGANALLSEQLSKYALLLLNGRGMRERALACFLEARALLGEAEENAVTNQVDGFIERLESELGASAAAAIQQERQSRLEDALSFPVS